MSCYNILSPYSQWNYMTFQKVMCWLYRRTCGTCEVQQFVCGVAVICKGRPEQKLRLLFMVYDTDKDQRLCLGLGPLGPHPGDEAGIWATDWRSEKTRKETQKSAQHDPEWQNCKLLSWFTSRKTWIVTLLIFLASIFKFCWQIVHFG